LGQAGSRSSPACASQRFPQFGKLLAHVRSALAAPASRPHSSWARAWVRGRQPLRRLRGLCGSLQRCLAFGQLPPQDRQLAIALGDLGGVALRHQAVGFALLFCLAGSARSSACAACVSFSGQFTAVAARGNPELVLSLGQLLGAASDAHRRASDVAQGAMKSMNYGRPPFRHAVAVGAGRVPQYAARLAGPGGPKT